MEQSNPIQQESTATDARRSTSLHLLCKGRFQKKIQLRFWKHSHAPHHIPGSGEASRHTSQQLWPANSRVAGCTASTISRSAQDLRSRRCRGPWFLDISVCDRTANVLQHPKEPFVRVVSKIHRCLYSQIETELHPV